MSKTEREVKTGMFQKYLNDISQIVETHQGEFLNPSPLVGDKETDTILYYEHKIVSKAFSEIWRILERAKENLEGQKEND